VLFRSVTYVILLSLLTIKLLVSSSSPVET